MKLSEASLWVVRYFHGLNRVPELEQYKHYVTDYNFSQIISSRVRFEINLPPECMWFSVQSIIKFLLQAREKGPFKRRCTACFLFKRTQEKISVHRNR